MGVAKNYIYDKSKEKDYVFVLYSDSLNRKGKSKKLYSSWSKIKMLKVK